MSERCPVSTAELLYQIGQIEDQFINKHLADIGLRMDHARLLHYVSEVSGTNQVKLAEFLNVQPATLTNMIKKLEKQNYIIRRVDPKDPHRKQIFLMDGGKKAIIKINEVFTLLNKTVEEAGIEDTPELHQLFDCTNLVV